MKLNELIRIADRAYPDGVLAAQWDFGKEDVRDEPEAGLNDTLAQFIVMEIKETYDPDADKAEQCFTASRQIERAADELLKVSAELAAN